MLVQSTPDSGEASSAEGADRTLRVWPPDPLALFLIASIGLGIAVRFAGLSTWSLWHDESFSWQLIQFPWSEVVERTASDVHPPAYYLLLKAWAYVLGDSEFRLRLLSSILGLGSLVGIYLCSNQLYGRDGYPEGRRPRGPLCPVGLLATALASLSVFLIDPARQVRMYSLGIFLSVWSSWMLLKALGGGPRSGMFWACYTLNAIGLAYTHNFGLFTTAAQGLFALMSICFARVGELGRNSRHVRSASARAAGLSFLCILLAYAPWIPTLLQQREQVVEDYWTSPLRFQDVSAALEPFVVNKTESRQEMLGGAAVIVVVAALAAVAARCQASDLFIVIMTAFPLGSAIVLSTLQGRNILVPRTLSFDYPFFLIGISSLVFRFPGRAIPAGLAVILTLNFAATDVCDRLQFDTSRYPGMRAAASFLQGQASEGDPIFTLESDGFMSMRYYLGRSRRPVIVREGRRLKHYQGSAVISPDDLLDSASLSQVRGTRAWVVLTSSRSDDREIVPAEWVPLQRQRFADRVPHRTFVEIRLYQTGL